MSLTAGTHIGAYEVVAPLGAGLEPSSTRSKFLVTSVRGSYLLVLFRAYLVLAVGLVLNWSPLSAARQEQALSDVLHRAGSYVEAFQKQLSGIVAEETYLQEILPFVGKVPKRVQRRLRSDLLLLRPGDAVTWVQFRDVFEVDGKPVRDRQERLAKLFLSGDLSTAKQVEEIIAQSARYNIGAMVRTMNVPVLPLAVLEPSSQTRFRFTVDDRQGNSRQPSIGTDAVPATPTFKVSAEVWIVKFEELKSPTLITTTGGGDILSHGRFWIEPDTGRVLVSEMITEDARIRGELLVSYQSQPFLGLLVPIELRERYTVKALQAQQPVITGQATYSNFRRFEVSVDQKIGPIQ
jgi:hypothetical protein